MTVQQALAKTVHIPIKTKMTPSFGTKPPSQQAVLNLVANASISEEPNIRASKQK